jgi:zinc transporter, ZIP family
VPSAISAGLWGGLGAISLVIGAVLAIRLNPSNRATGAVMGFGAGALLGSIAYDLVPESLLKDGGWGIVVALTAGALTFFAGDWLIDRGGGQHRKRIGIRRRGSPVPSPVPDPSADRAVRPSGGSGTAIFLGTLLDGIPESLVLGLGLALGGMISWAFLVAVFVSNIPEGVAGTTSMISEGHSQRRVLLMWIGLVVASAAAAGLGYLFGSTRPSADGRIAQSFAAGAMLTMLADTMMPEAFEHGGKVVGLLTTLGFLMAAIFAALE